MADYLFSIDSIDDLSFTIFVVALLLKRIKYDNIAETGIHLSSASLNTTSGDLPVTLSLTSLLIKKRAYNNFFFPSCVDRILCGSKNSRGGGCNVTLQCDGERFFFPYIQHPQLPVYIFFLCLC